MQLLLLLGFFGSYCLCLRLGGFGSLADVIFGGLALLRYSLQSVGVGLHFLLASQGLLSLGRSLFCRSPRTGFLRLALAPALCQFFFLAANEFCLTTRFFFTPRQISMINGRSRICHNCGGSNGVRTFVTPDKSPLFTDFHLNRARLASGISLLDFSR
ncbi:hypothetical protein GALL_486870 [mine drainage metagenome]|uniref:Uncharacterized protein n=1 Tax=mine drainage metagenome TaxID=410659 RepID=A0A1J5PEC2_9ZZZZ